MPWLLQRTDDNGAVVVIAKGLTRSQAHERMLLMMARGHKQLYEVREDAPAAPAHDASVAQR